MMTKMKNPLSGTLRAPALPLIALCFATTAALKTGEVIAALDADPPAMETPAPDSTSMMPETAHPDPPVPPSEDSHTTGSQPPAMAKSNSMTEACVSDELMAAIRERSTALDVRAAQLAGKTRALEVAEKRVAEEITRLEANRKSLERILAEARSESGEDMTRLVQIYANMKPKQAAIIFDEMAPQIAAGFIRRMRGNAASFILANMDSKKAYAITLLIAGAEAPFQNN